MAAPAGHIRSPLPTRLTALLSPKLASSAVCPRPTARLPSPSLLPTASAATGKQKYTLTVNPAIHATPTSLPAVGLGLVYTQQITASGGSGKGYTFTTSSPLDGLTLSAAGLLSGQPTKAGTFPITVRITDSNGATGSKAYTLSVIVQQQTIGVLRPLHRQLVPSQQQQRWRTQSSFSSSALPAGIPSSATGTATASPPSASSISPPRPGTCATAIAPAVRATRPSSLALRVGFPSSATGRAPATPASAFSTRPPAPGISATK